MRIAAAQYPITYHDSFRHWQSHTEQWIQDAVQQQAQLLLFPEYGAMELVSIFPEPIQKDVHQQLTALQSIYIDFCRFFEEMAMKYKVIIVAPSFPVQEEHAIYNRVNVFSAKGFAGYQDKFFMTRFEEESWKIHSAPKVLSVFETADINFGIQICYDAEFAIGAKLLGDAGAELILAPSCTETLRGATRVHVGARARALENQCYVAVAQTIGDALWSPAVDINYGYAAIYTTADVGFPEEGILVKGKAQEAGWVLADLDSSKIKQVRSDGQVLNYKNHQALEFLFKNESIQVQIIKCEIGKI